VEHPFNIRQEQKRAESINIISFSIMSNQITNWNHEKLVSVIAEYGTCSRCKASFNRQAKNIIIREGHMLLFLESNIEPMKLIS